MSSSILDTFSVEDKIRELVCTIPPLVYQGESYDITFKPGDQMELNHYLLNKEGEMYPLIWLLTGFSEEQKRKEYYCENVNIIIAVQSNGSIYFEERLDVNYKDKIFPLLKNFKKAITRGNTVSLENDFFRVQKFPNYSARELASSDDQDTSASTDIWDAVKVTMSLRVFNRCLKEIIY